MRVVLLLWLATWLTGCDEGTSRVRGVSCATNYECTAGAVFGTCQDNGFCAYPDAMCAGGSRYAPGAGDVASQCVAGECGAGGEACCPMDVCDSGFACNEGTCACGAVEGGPCCAGDVCGGNLACNASGTCSCGGPDEPCCGGTTCDGGATCTNGSCPATYNQIALMRNVFCGLRTDGVVVCWGDDHVTYTRDVPGQGVAVIDTLSPLPITGATSVAELKAGSAHACVRKLDNTLWCWGHGEHGQLGNGMTTSSRIAVQVTGLTAVTQFSVGRRHTCAAGTVAGVTGLYCWGHNGRGNHGQNAGALESLFGNNTRADSAVPVAVDMSMMAASGQTVRLVAASGHYTCAVMSDERMWCWGDNGYGNLGTGDTTASMVPRLVDMSQITIPSGVTIAQILGGTDTSYANATCMRLSDGTVYCWGYGLLGALGDNAGVQRSRPEVAVLSTALAGATFTKLTAITGGVCGLDSTGKVWCWGSSSRGQLGNGDANNNVLAPTQVLDLPMVTDVAGAHRTACALDAAKHLWCWGNNRRGVITRSVPTSDDNVHFDRATEVLP